MTDRLKYVKMDCGIHWGSKGGPCAKCAYFTLLDERARALGFASYRDQMQEAERRARILGPPLPKPSWWPG